MSIIPDEYTTLIKVGVIGAAIVGAFTYGHHVGYTGEKAEFDKYVAAQEKLAADQVVANNAALDAKKAEYAANIDKVQKEKQDEVDQIIAQRDAALADSARSAGQLRDFLARARAADAQVSGAASGVGGSDGKAGAQFLDGVSILNQWLLVNLSRADVYSTRLAEAQLIIKADRVMCDGRLPGVSK